ncbi:type II toxin-antitoxin system RelE/ParE family toxin [candidate division KSB1 bacterium]|nr:type II toxin-antitoxin system RelE/ParE family toxin [candidate division KSB1 bacterium]MBL7093510.1 type II toxin-antitoxin system RelE/ParE family toxin [candidate division KSB1 bacterium]
MEVEFIEQASIELDDAIEYYNLQLLGLGDQFFEEVLNTLALILQYPEIWAKNTAHTRKAVLKKFPYVLIYTKYKNKVYILAVAHQHRKPEYWINRLQNFPQNL